MCGLSIGAICLASIVFYVGFYHLLFYLQTRETRENLAFAVNCISIGIYDLFCAGLYNAQSIYAGVMWQRWQFIAIVGVATSLVWFISEFIARTSRRTDYLFYAYGLIQFIVLLFDHSELTFRSKPEEKIFELFGIPASYHEVAPGLLVNIQCVVNLLVCLYILKSLVAFYRAGRREESGPIIVGTVCLVAGAINDTLVSARVYQFFYIIEYAYLCLVLAMAYSLTRSHLRIQSALRMSEENYRNLVNRLPDVIYTVSSKGVILSINNTCLEFFGYTQEEMLEREFLRFVHPDDVTVAQTAFQRAVVSKRTAPPGTITLRIIRKNGETRWISLNGSLTQNERGEVVSLQGVIRDITESRKAEANLARLAAAVSAAEESIIITDTTGTIQYVNPCFEQMTGYSRNEILGKNPRLLNSGKHDRAFYAKLWATISSGETWRGHFTNRKKDGTLFEEEAVISPVRDASDKIVNYVAVKRDVTQQKALESQLRHSQTMEAIGQLAKGVTHDFTNMLVVITNSLHLAKGKLAPLAPDIQQYFDNIANAANRAADLTGQLLAFSHQQPVTLRDMDLNKSVGGVKEMILRTLNQNIRLAVRVSSEPNIVKIDPAQMEQVIVHLVVNASDAMPNGGRLTIETSHLTLSPIEAIQLSGGIRMNDMVSGPLTVLTISDTGTGMTKEIQTHVFEPFFTTKGKGKSTGLGLSTVYAIVQQHGGVITVYSNPGVGTTFAIYLPLVNVAKAMPESAESPTRIRHAETILLLEEEPLGRSILARILKESGYTVLEADNAKTALALAQDRDAKIDLLMCDLFLAGVDGRKFADNLKRLHPESKVIFLSGYPASHLTDQELLKPEETLIAKPFATSVIEPAVWNLLTR
jgi:PAS domain S-box-containing protein